MQTALLAIAVVLISLAGGQAAFAEGCPAGADKAYCDVAQSTGGKVSSDLNDVKDVAAPQPTSKEVIRHNSMFSRQLGCEYQAKGEDQNLCLLLQAKQEWTWLGHGGAFPGWRVTFKTICGTYYKYEIAQAHLPQLERMRKVNFGDIDWRLQTGLDGLIRILKGQGNPSAEDASSVFNPQNSSYILKDKCGN